MAQWTQNRSIITGLRTSRWSPDCRAHGAREQGMKLFWQFYAQKECRLLKPSYIYFPRSVLELHVCKEEERVVSCELNCCQTKKAVDNEDSSLYLSHVVSWDTRHERGVSSRWLLSVTRVTSSYLQTPPPDQPVSHLRPAACHVPHCLQQRPELTLHINSLR